MSIISGGLPDTSRMLKESQGAVGLIVLGLHRKHDLRFITRLLELPTRKVLPEFKSSSAGRSIQRPRMYLTASA